MNKLVRKKPMLYGLLLAGAVMGLVIDRLHSADDGSAVSVRSDRADSTSVSGAVRPASSSGGPADKPEVKGPAIARIFEAGPAGGAPGSLPAGVHTGGQTARGTSAAVRDAFMLTPAMRRVYEEESPVKKAEQAKKAEDDEELRRQEAAHFRDAHKLKGTTLAALASWAVIDDKVVRLGEQIDGFELLRVERYRVQLKKNDLLVTLSLPVPH